MAKHDPLHAVPEYNHTSQRKPKRKRHTVKIVILALILWLINSSPNHLLEDKFDSSRSKVQYIDERNHFDLYIVDYKSLLGFLQNPHFSSLLRQTDYGSGYDLIHDLMNSPA